ncbi:unnamed protein product [Camellia sinensis]
MKCLLGSVIVNSNVQLLFHLLRTGAGFFGELTKVSELGLFDCKCCHFIELGWWRRRRDIMAEGEEHIELKFRIYDGTDIAHTTYAPSTTVATLKQRLVAEWPQDKSVVPKSVSDLKLIHAGKVLENIKTLEESKINFGDLPGGVITMHVVVQPPVAKKKTETRARRRCKRRIHAHAPYFELGSICFATATTWFTFLIFLYVVIVM